MTQTIQSNNTISGQNRYIEITQGGAPFYYISRSYWNYDFNIPSSESYNPEIGAVFAEIGKEFVLSVSKNYVAKLSAQASQKTWATQNIFGKWKPPVYENDELMTDVKEKLKQGKYSKLIWADYMWYAEFPYRSFITNMMTSNRSYSRGIHILCEEIDWEMVKYISDCRIILSGICIRIYPHSKIEYEKNDKETLRNYVHRDDFIFQIGYSPQEPFMTIQPNPKYMNFEQMMATVVPIFEKYGFIIKDKTQPYLKDGFSLEDEFKYHKEYPCAGYQFFD